MSISLWRPICWPDRCPGSSPEACSRAACPTRWCVACSAASCSMPARASAWERSDPMYLYDEIDQRVVDERVAQFRDQTRRFMAGKLSEEEFRALRLRNGLYIQRYAPMLRIAIPYGLLSSRQLRKLAE